MAHDSIIRNLLYRRRAIVALRPPVDPRCNWWQHPALALAPRIRHHLVRHAVDLQNGYDLRRQTAVLRPVEVCVEGPGVRG